MRWESERARVKRRMEWALVKGQKKERKTGHVLERLDSFYSILPDGTVTNSYSKTGV